MKGKKSPNEAKLQEEPNQGCGQSAFRLTSYLPFPWQTARPHWPWIWHQSYSQTVEPRMRRVGWAALFTSVLQAIVAEGRAPFTGIQRNVLFQMIPTCICHWLAQRNLLLCCYSFGLDFWPHHGFVPIILNARPGPMWHTPLLCPWHTPSTRPHIRCLLGAALCSLNTDRSLGLSQQPTAFCSCHWTEPTMAWTGGRTHHCPYLVWLN